MSRAFEGRSTGYSPSRCTRLVVGFVVSLFLASAPAKAVVVFSDDFNSGLGAWETGNSVGDNRWWWHPPEGPNVPGEPAGNFLALAWNCQPTFGCILTPAAPIDLSSFQSATLSFWRFVNEGVGPTGFLVVDIFDGTQWLELARWTDGQGDDDQWSFEQFSIPTSYLVSGFNLRIRSRGSYTAVDNLVIDAFNAGNAAPVANAGADVTVTDADLDGSEVVPLTGSGTDSDGTIQGYQWTEGATVLGTTASISPTLTVGVHVLTLTVTDDGGATGTDTVTVTVNAGNAAPVANAGADVTVTDADLDGSEVVPLTGSGTDSDGTIQGYQWTEGATVLGTTASISPTLTVGVHVLTLTVTDDGGATGTDTVTVTVNAGNAAPVANAGADVTVTDADLDGSEVVPLTGSGTDSDGTIQGYQWTEGATVLGTTASISPTLTVGVHVLTLTVTDDGGATGTDTVTVTVNAGNAAPVANAGADVTVTDADLDGSEVVPLTGSGTDSDGTIQGYQWTEGATVLGTTASISPTLTVGVHVLTLTVTDDGGATGTDTVTVTVNAGNAAPVANAGADVTVTDADLDGSEVVPLTGSGTDSDGTIQGYQWTEGATVLGTTASISPTLTVGVHVLTLTVTDDGGATGTDTVTVTVNAGNAAPVANAGADVTVTDADLDGSEVVPLTGSGTDSDGTIQGYQWTEGATVLGTTASISPTLTVGVHVLTLTVTDDGGATGTDTVTVTVNAGNAAPVANAGADVTVTDADLDGSEVVPLTGSGTDSDGTIQGYQWTEGATVLGTTASISPTLTVGVHVLTLTVTDDGGATGTDTVTVTVNAGNAAPVANAGADVTVTDADLDGSEVVPLTGSGTDSDGTIQGYQWTEGATVLGTTASISPTLTVGVHVLTLTVTDDGGATGTDTVTVTVNAGNAAPVANAGADVTVTDADLDGSEVVPLTGSGTDSDGTIQGYQWTEGATVLGTTASISPTLTVGVHVLTLTVTDDGGATGTDTVTVTVNAGDQEVTVFFDDLNNGLGSWTETGGNGDNQWQPHPPIGPNVPGEPANNFLALAWNCQPTSGCVLTLAAPLDMSSYQAATLGFWRLVNSGLTAADFLVAEIFDGTQWLELARWTEGQGDNDQWNLEQLVVPVSYLVNGFNVRFRSRGTYTSIDNVVVNATAAPTNQPPTAQAGADVTVSDLDGDGSETVPLAGSGMDSDGTIQGYQWTEGATVLGTTASISPTLTVGVHVLTLTVTDDGGATGTDTVTVTVNAGNAAPVANAGADIVASDGDNDGFEVVTLIGSGTDTDGTIQSYLWTEGSTTLGNSATINPSLSIGIHTLTLTVTDDLGLTGTDTVAVTVNVNTPPVVDAGQDQTVFDADASGDENVNLIGSASDVDGSVATVQWTNGATVLGNTANVTTLLPVGTHALTFSATDNGGATTQDNVTINVVVPPNQPNIVVIMSDNQDTDSLVAMPYLQSVFSPQAASLTQAITSYPLCCPSRATFFTGQYAHNHNVLANFPPNGGIGPLDQSNTLPVWLQTAGYFTGHVGRYLNGYGTTDTTPGDGVDACHGIPPGWDDWYAAVGVYEHFYNFAVNNNGQVESYNGSSPSGCTPDSAFSQVYQTDLFVNQAVSFINSRGVATDGKPFFLNLWFGAPHGVHTAGGDGPEPAPRHAGTYSGVSVPQTLKPSFNEADVSDKPPFVAAQPLLDGGDIANTNVYYQRRAESLLAVDEGIQSVMQALTDNGFAGNTIVVYTSDQGENLGEHRIDISDGGGIGWSYEESIRMPLLIQGPGIPSGANTSLVGNIDFAPTILEWAQGTTNLAMDGISFVAQLTNPNSSVRTGILLESTNDGRGEFRGVHVSFGHSGVY